jgi:hypothetical protein
MRTDGRTDGHIRTNSRFSQFYERAYNMKYKFNFEMDCTNYLTGLCDFSPSTTSKFSHGTYVSILLKITLKGNITT